MSEGEPLTGGSVTAGIVRIGDTVRRPLRPFSLTVQAYLAHLRDAGFGGAPRPLGVDEQGREILSFVPGQVHRHPLPPEAAGDDVLVALARLIRKLHEASAGWVPPPGAAWGGTPARQGPVTERAELVSHRDYATGNVVFRGGLPVALIDFDLARPTTRLDCPEFFGGCDLWESWDSWHHGSSIPLSCGNARWRWYSSCVPSRAAPVVPWQASATSSASIPRRSATGSRKRKLTAGSGLVLRVTTRSASRNSKGRTVSCGGRMRS